MIPNVKMVTMNLKMRASSKSHIAEWTPGPAAAISIAEFTLEKFRL